MLDHANEAIHFAAGRQRNDLDEDRTLELVLTRLIEIVGEAANRLPSEIQARHPEVDWRGIIGTRHRLAHGYDLVDLDILWDIVAVEFPRLVAQLDVILAAWSS